jgi:hypothetical protein
MLTWNALRAANADPPGSEFRFIRPPYPTKKETAGAWPAVSQPGAAVRTGGIPPV